MIEEIQQYFEEIIAKAKGLWFSKYKFDVLTRGNIIIQQNYNYYDIYYNRLERIGRYNCT